MTFYEQAITVGVLVGVFLLAYSAIRHQRMLDTINEFKQMFNDRVGEKIELKYA